jgi:integrase
MGRRSEKPVSFTDRFLKTVNVSQAQQDFWDLSTPNFGLRVSGTTGRRSFLVRYTSAGRRRSRVLGVYPEMSLAEARALAREHIGAADADRDLRAEETAARVASQERTLGRFWHEFLGIKRTRGARERTLRDYRLRYEKYLAAGWGDRPMDTISKAEVAALVAKIAKKHPIQANRVLALIQNIWNTAIKQGFGELILNPAAHVEKLPEGRRDRWLSPDELRRFWAELPKEGLVIEVVMKVALLTGQRIGQILQMKWEDLDGATWKAPGHTTKGNRRVWTPLAPTALEEIERLRGLSDLWVFPQMRSDASAGHLTSHVGAVRRVCDRAGIEDFGIHDARTTLTTYATLAVDPVDPSLPPGLGVTLEVADALLAHKPSSLALERYRGLLEAYLLAEKRDAFLRWADMLLLMVREN